MKNLRIDLVKSILWNTNNRKRHFIVAILIASIVVLCPGCLLSDLDNGHVATRYHSGLKCMEAGDYDSAAQLFYDAYRQAGTYGVPPKVKGFCAYNLAICTGQLGKLEQAESWFKGALAIFGGTEGKDGPSASSCWFELARLYQAWGKYGASVEAYEKAFPLEAKYGYDKNNPMADAVMWDDYARVLKEAGFDAKAKVAEIHAQEIRGKHKGETAKVPFRYYPASRD
jgi:tetratricopeptide (TPR) repeat protein